MGRDLRQEAFEYLLKKAEKQGYITFDDIMDCADEKSLPIQDFDWLSSAIATHGIIIYDEVPTKSISDEIDDDNYDDYAQSDYEVVYNRIIALDSSLIPFISEIRNIRPPQWKEFSQLKYQVLEGNQHARGRMIEMHLRLAVKIALQRAENYEIDIQDAIGEACVGLVKAVDKYNPDVNGPFGSYASMWILQNLTRHQPSKRPLIYYPVNKKENYFAVYPFLKENGYIGETDVIEEEVIRDLLQNKYYFTNEQIDDVLNLVTPLESFEDSFSMFLMYNDVFEKHDFELEEKVQIPEVLISDNDIEEQVAENTLIVQLTEIIGTLTEREQEIIKHRYGLMGYREKTLEEIGVKYKVSRERIRQIEAKALRKLRHPSRCKRVRDFCE